MMKRFFFLSLAILLVASSLAQQSRNGEFSARIQQRAGAKHAREHNSWIATIVDKSGRLQYQITKEVAFDVQFPSLHIGNNGAAVVISSFEGTVEFFTPTGILARTLLPFGKRTSAYEQNIKCSLAGDRTALLFSTPAEERSTVLATDLNGNELWRSPLKGRQAGEVFLSADAQYLAAGSYTFDEKVLRVTEVFDAAGRALRSFSFLFRQADISGKGRILLAERENVLFGSIADNQQPGRWIARGNNKVVTAGRIVGNFCAIIVETANLPLGKVVYQNPTLVVFNGQGKEVARTHLVSSSPSPAVLSVNAHEVKCSTPSGQTTLSLASLQ